MKQYITLVTLILISLYQLILGSTLIQPFSLSLNFKNINTATPNQHTDFVFLTADSTPARIGVVNLKTFEQVEQVLLVRNVWIQGCDFCYARNLLFCLAKNSDGDQLKMLRINQSKVTNNSISLMNNNIIENPIVQNNVESVNNRNEMNKENIESDSNQNQNNNKKYIPLRQSYLGKYTNAGETEFDELSVADFGFQMFCSVAQDNDYMYVAYTDKTNIDKQGIYVVDKETFKVSSNSTFVSMQGVSNRLILPCSHDIKIFVYQNYIYTLCVIPEPNGQESTLVYVVGRSDMFFYNSFKIPMRVTGQLIRDGTVEYVAMSTVFFFSNTNTKLLPYTIYPFQAQTSIDLKSTFTGGITCAVMDGLQQFAYLFTTGPLVTILKLNLQSGKVIDTYNLHNAGDVSTCFLDRTGRYLYFGQNLLDTSSLMEFSLDAFVPNQIMEMEQLPVSFIINGALTTVDPSMSFSSNTLDRRMYLVTETNPAKIIEVSVDGNGQLSQSNFLNLPEENLGGIKAMPIFNDARTHAYFARASNPGIIYQVELRNLQIVNTHILSPPLGTVVASMKSNKDKNVGIFATATTPSYVFTFCLNSLTVISMGIVADYRLSIFSFQTKDGRYAFFITDSLPATVVKIELETMRTVDSYTLNSYPTCSMDSEDRMWLGLRSGKVVSILKANLSSIAYSNVDIGGAPLSCVSDSNGKFGFFAVEQFSEGTTLVKLSLDIDNMRIESSTFLDVRGMFRTAFFDERDKLAYFVNYGSRTTILPVELTTKPIDFWIIALVVLICVIILGLILVGGLYINLKKRWWLRNKAEREIRKKLLQHDGLSSGNSSYGSMETSSTWIIPPEDIVLQTRVSEGAYGMVFKGEWQGAVVAIKKIKINDHLGGNTDSLFTREVSIIRSLRHPNIVQFLGISILEDSQRFIVTEYVPNGDLSRYIRSAPGEPPLLSLTIRIKILEDISKGMLYLHSLSPPLIHRDLKPSNILLDSSYQAKVCDFGLSAHNKQITMTGNIGTIQFMSNEVISETKYDQSADVYSFGILCYEVIFLREAFAGTNPFRLGMEILNGRRPVITEMMLRDDPVLIQLSILMKQCWDADPQSRPTFKTILETLHLIQEEKKNIESSAGVSLRIN